MICEFCDGKTQKKSVTKLHRLQGNFYLLENVAAEVCQECGERYFHATTLDRIDVLLNAEHQVKQRIELEVVSLT